MDYGKKYSKDRIISVLSEEYLKHGRKLKNKEIVAIEGMPSVQTIKIICDVKNINEMWKEVKIRANKERKLNEYKKPMCECENELECHNYVTYKSKCVVGVRGTVTKEVYNSRKYIEETFILKCSECKKTYKASFDEQGRIYKGDLIK